MRHADVTDADQTEHGPEETGEGLLETARQNGQQWKPQRVRHRETPMSKSVSKRSKMSAELVFLRGKLIVMREKCRKHVKDFNFYVGNFYCFLIELQRLV